MNIFMYHGVTNNPLWAGPPRPKGLRVPTSKKMKFQDS